MGTTNIEIEEIVKKLNISNFRGVIMRDEFIKLKPSLKKESIIYNLQDSNDLGSHWCAIFKNDNNFFHFCPFGGNPSKEAIEYAMPNKIYTHDYRIQEYDDKNCAEWCLLFIYLMNKNLTYSDVILFLTK